MTTLLGRILAEHRRLAVTLGAVLALNVADELFRCRDANRERDGQLAERAGELERLLDRILMA